MTLTLIVLNVLIFAIQLMSGMALREAGVMFAPAIRAGEWHRLFTAPFLHTGVAHLAGSRARCLHHNLERGREGREVPAQPHGLSLSASGESCARGGGGRVVRGCQGLLHGDRRSNGPDVPTSLQCNQDYWSLVVDTIGIGKLSLRGPCHVRPTHQPHGGGGGGGQ